jgi:hypothetical protein
MQGREQEQQRGGRLAAAVVVCESRGPLDPISASSLCRQNNFQEADRVQGGGPYSVQPALRTRPPIKYCPNPLIYGP